jgi:hypothetical protein
MLKAKVWKGLFSIIKSKKPMEGSFAVINDKNEITSIISQGKASKKDTIKAETDYKLITFDMVLPFSMVGFIAKIAKELAKEKIPIFVISSYSTDHVLVRKKHLNKSLNALKRLGFKIK